ncbi:molybdopterin converting factor small subunit [Evansella vedderi]|uniref:Molybdopterin converting factor small subunit n=1 Tax=Evansella vedderi TaxID=38282 RepID=A0ABT9ZU05_9BACI|nr:MoaD/ThiS family protein [Evansella vedderi]MDQ0254689.1 molybdopterin converting factor small subunit [Evansella vedderi]
MIIKVVSFIPYLENINGEYQLEKEATIEKFVNSLGIKWDDDALVVVNNTIVKDRTMLLNDGDFVQLLIPLSGG